MARKQHIKQPYPTDRYLQRIKDFYGKNGRVPKAEECGQWTNKILVKRFGSWDAAIQAAVGKPGTYRRWDTESIRKLLQEKQSALNRFPGYDDLSAHDKSIVSHHYGSMIKACEALIGGSVRTHLLYILDRLTPPGCSNATTQEIHAEAVKTGYTVTINEVRRYLDLSQRERLLSIGKTDRTTWWSLTHDGKSFIQQFKGVRNGKDRTQ